MIKEEKFVIPEGQALHTHSKKINNANRRRNCAP